MVGWLRCFVLSPCFAPLKSKSHLSISSWLILMLSNINMNPQKNISSLRPAYVDSPDIRSLSPCGCCVRSTSSSQLPTRGCYLAHQYIFTDVLSFDFLLATATGKPLEMGHLSKPAALQAFSLYATSMAATRVLSTTLLLSRTDPRCVIRPSAQVVNFAD